MRHIHLYALYISAIILFTFMMSCSNSDLSTNTTVNQQTEEINDFNLSVVDGRLKFNTAVDFNDLAKMNKASRDVILKQHDFDQVNRKNTSFTSSDKYVIDNAFMRSIVDENNMYQIGNKVYLETHDFQYVVNEKNVDILLNKELIDERTTAFIAANSSTKKVLSRGTLKESDLIISPILRSADFSTEQHPCDEIGATNEDECPDDGGGLLPPDPPQTIYLNFPNDPNSTNVERRYYNQTYRATFRSDIRQTLTLYSAEPHIKHEKSTKTLGIPTVWNIRVANTLSISSGSVYVYYEDGSFGSDFVNGAFGTDVSSITAYGLNIPNGEAKIVDRVEGTVTGTVFKNVSNDSNYSITQTIGFYNLY